MTLRVMLVSLYETLRERYRYASLSQVGEDRTGSPMTNDK